MPLPIYSYGRDLAAFGITDDPQWRSDEQEYRLRNSIHPIWQQDNIRVAGVDMFDDDAIMDFYKKDPPDSRMPDIVYERLKPAFQLASIMLEASEPFFSKVRCAKVGTKKYRRYEEGLDNTFHFCVVGELDRDYVASEANRKSYRRMWTELETGYVIIFRNDASTDPWDLEKNHGSTTYVDCATKKYKRTGDERDMDRLMFTDIEARFLEFFRADQGDPFRLASAQARNRYCFDLAALLLHELTHVVWMYRDRDNRGEVLYDRRQPEVELGFAWERYFLGGITRHVQDPLRSAKHGGLTWYLDQYIPASPSDTNKFLFDRHCGVKAVSVNHFFSPQCWESHRRAVQQAKGSPVRSGQKPQGIAKQSPRGKQNRSCETLAKADSFVLELTPHQVVGLFSASEVNFDRLFRCWLGKFREGHRYMETTVDEVMQREES